jgi:hypothetical protein
LLRYDALAARPRGHVLLVCVSGTPDAFLTHEPLVRHILHSMAPYKPRRAPADPGCQLFLLIAYPFLPLS